MSNIETEHITEVQVGPGAILRNAREMRGLDITAVAAMLHLSESKLLALESDDFDSLPEPVFVRGYLKNYARLLEEPVAPVLDAYAQFSYTVELPEQPFLDSHIKVELNGNPGWAKQIGYVIAAALIALLFIWLWDYLELAAQKIVDSVTPKVEQSSSASAVTKNELGLPGFTPPSPPGFTEMESATEQSEPEETKERVKATLELKPAAAPVVSVIKELKSDNVESKPIAIPLPSEVADEIQPAIEATPEPVVAAVAPTTQPKPVAVVKGVVFDFVDSSWLKVRDAKNRVILIGEYKKGARKKLKGKMPYKVVLGNSNALKITIDGKMSSIERFSSGGVARFTIMDGKIVKP